MDLIVAGFSAVLSLQAVALMFVGVIVGIIFGSIPGLSAVTAIALALPLTFAMDPTVAIALMMSIYVGGSSGGFIAAILLNIPGTPASVATTFDGHPMAQKGQAGKALGTAVVCSFLGGLVSMVALLTLAPPLASISMRFGAAEYFATTFFALVLLGGLTGGSLVKGLISGLLGLLLATIGSAPIDYTDRFTFGFVGLSGGLSAPVVLIGIFAISEVVKAARRKALPAAKARSMQIRGFGVELREIAGQSINILRSAIIGVFVGVLPGIGGSAASLLSYSAARGASKKPEEFGKGSTEGLVASESANNAVMGGAMIPLLTLGIPGDVVTALLLGALMLYGLSPGPLLMLTDADLLYAIFAAMLISNCIMLVVQFAGIRLFVKALSVDRVILLPVIISMCAVGVYSFNNTSFDVVLFSLFGLFGYVCFKLEFPFPPLVVGFILGPILEVNLRRGLMLNDGNFLAFFSSPIAATFFVASIGFILFTVWKRRMEPVKA